MNKSSQNVWQLCDVMVTDIFRYRICEHDSSEAIRCEAV